MSRNISFYLQFAALSAITNHMCLCWAYEHNDQSEAFDSSLQKTSSCSLRAHTSYVSVQSYELNLCAKLEYRIKHLQVKHRFHPVS